MNKSILFGLLLLSLFFNACDTNQQPERSTDELLESDDTQAETSEILIDCKPDFEILEGNRLLIRDMGLAVFIGADSSTYDENFGEGHRVLITMSIKDTCEIIDRQILPVNDSPDIPYFFADISYHRTHQVIALKSLKKVLTYNLKTKKISDSVEPVFMNEREYADAQSGNIQRLEVWEDHLIGYAMDLGVFVFSIDQDGRLKSVLPLVEYQMEESIYSPLFLIQSENAQMQAIIPGVPNLPPYSYSIEPIFENPIAFRPDPQFIKGHYLVLGKKADGTQLLVDFEKRKRVELPDNISKGAIEDIEAWLQ